MSFVRIFFKLIEIDGKSLLFATAIPKKKKTPLQGGKCKEFNWDFTIPTAIFIFSLANQEPGPLNHSRWLTMANRIARKYVATARPSKPLQKMAHAIVNFYAPSWFQIKTHPYCTDGPKNILKMVQFSKKLDKDLQEVVEKRIQRNGFFAHPEALLLPMLADENINIRQQATATIMRIRQSQRDKEDAVSAENEQEEIDFGEEEEIDDDDGEQLVLEPYERNAISSSNILNFSFQKSTLLQHHIQS